MKIGLKLWSINTDYYYDDAIRLYKNNIFDYIELYIVPNTTETIKKWEKIGVPFMLHAPHFAHNVNLANPDYLEYNKKIYEQVEIFRRELNAEFTIVHGGTHGNINEVIKQLNIIKPKNILIENKPYKAPFGDNELCRGYNIEEITKILKNVDCKFCLDIGHAICTANSLNIEPYQYISEFNKLNPQYYHISDGDINSEIDMHLNIGEGNFNFKKIFNIINKSKPIAIETKKISKENLHEFYKDVLKIQKIMEGI